MQDAKLARKQLAGRIDLIISADEPTSVRIAAPRADSGA